MINNNQHIIQKVSAELTLPSAEEQEERSAQLKTALYEALENFGEKLDQQFDDVTYRIDYLSVDISLAKDSFSQLANRLEQSLVEKVLKAGEKVAITLEGANIEKVNPSDRRQEVLSHFLETGRLPWWANELYAFEQMEQELNKMDGEALREVIKSIAECDDLPLFRIVEQFPEETVREFLKKYAKQNNEHAELLAMIDNFSVFLDGQEFAYGLKQRLVTSYYAKILAGMVDELPHQEVLEELLKTFVRDILALQTEESAEETVREFLKKYAKQNSEHAELFAMIDNFSAFLDGQGLAYGVKQRLITSYHAKILAGMVDEQPHKEIMEMLLTTFLRDISAIETDESLEELLRISEFNRNEKLLQLLEEGRIEIDKGGPETDENPNDFEEEVWTKTDGESLNVSSGGLVLMHPFIELFFKNLGLLEDGAFTDKAARERAICLLHYLCTGKEEFPEPALILPKFLCAWPLGQTVNRFLPISDYEKEECEVVLNSVIEHWEALKNTSIAGLRSNFLQRGGLLREEEFDWSLRVEQRTQDILLEKLPWGLSIVKFLWMDNMLTVKWT